MHISIVGLLIIAVLFFAGGMVVEWKSVIDKALAKIYRPVYIICALGLLVLQYVIYRYSF